MSKPTRTIRGSCWTCTLRRKKCDSGVPHCSTCEFLRIQCYGYGSKPDWMDGGYRQKEKRAEIRDIVKKTTDSLRHFRATKGAVPCPTKDVFHVKSSRTEKMDLDTSLGHAKERSSLTCYIDHVFPLQFPFYAPKHPVVGVSWLYGFLSKTEIVCNAALALSFFHQQSNPDFGDGLRSFGVDQPELYELYDTAVTTLRQHVEMLSKKTFLNGFQQSLEILACIILLVFIEVGKGSSGSWHVHLYAASNLNPFLELYNGFPEPGLRDTPLGKEVLERKRINAMGKEIEEVSLVDMAAMEFFGGVILWLDIIACATTNSKPRYPEICTVGLKSEQCRMQFKNLMGCESWVMILIRDIAILNDWKNHGVHQHLDDMAEELEARQCAIKNSLSDGLLKLTRRISESQENGKAQDVGTISRLQVTHVFLASAFVYLEVAVSGPNSQLSVLQNAVAYSIATFQSLGSQDLLGSLVWPFCISACMAMNTVDQCFFRNLYTIHKVDRTSLGGLRHALEVAEMCWKMREIDNNDPFKWEWTRAMNKLGYKLLLI